MNRYVNKVVGEVIREFVQEKSDGFYIVDFGNIAYILNNGRFLLSDFEFQIDPDVSKNINYENLDQQYIYTASIPNLHIDIIDFWSIIVKKKLRVIGVEVNSPEVKIINLNKNKTPKKISFEAGNLYEVLSGNLEELKINDFAINDGTFDFQTYKGADYENYYIEGLTFKVENFQVNEKSVDRDDKFFYTDDIHLEIGNQEILLKDSIHKLEFGKFYLSTKNNEIRFQDLKLTRKKETEVNLKQHDHYEIYVPDLRFTGIDFISAYNDNFLLIDSISIREPSISLVKRTAKQNKDTKRDNFLDIAMMYHDYLEIDHFNLTDANLSFTDEIHSQPKQYNVDHITASLSNFKIDTGQHSLRPYGFDFNNIELMVKDYVVTLPDSANTMKFDELVISSNPPSITLRDMFLTPDEKKISQPDKGKIHVHLPYLAITGFDIPSAINKSAFDIQELYIEQPEIEIIPAIQKSDKTEKPTDLKQLLQSVQKFSNHISLSKFHIADGRLLMDTNSDNAAGKINLNNIDLLLENILIDSATTFDDEFVSKIALELGLEKSQYSTPNEKVDLENFRYSSKTGILKIDTLNFSGNNDNLNISIPEIYLTGFDVKDVILKPEIQLDTFHISDADIVLTKNDNASTQIKEAKKKPIQLPAIKINHLIGNNYHLTYQNESSPIFVGNDIDIHIEGLILDQSLSEKTINQFDFAKIHQLYVDHYYFHLQEQKHYFSANQINWTNNSNFSMENISLVPYQNPDNEYRINVPSIKMTGIDLKRILKESYYDGKEINIHQPQINLKLAKGRQKNLTNLDLGFIPLLLRNRFLGAQAEVFKINQGVINVRQNVENDSLILECDNFNLVVDQFKVDSTTEMVPDKFLFAHDVHLHGDYISFYHQQKGDFASINHFDISTRDRDLLFEGLYFATNTKDKPELSKAKVTADHLNIIDLDFFNLTQNRMLLLSEISIDNGNFSIKPLAKNITDQQTTDGQNAQSQDYNPAKEKSKGLKMHEKEYLFDTLLLKQVEIDKIFLNNSSLEIENSTEHRANLKIPEIWLLAEGLKYNPVLARDTSRIFYSDNILTKISNFEYILPDNLSAVKFNELYFNLADSSINIKNFALEPRISKFDYGPAKGYQTTWLKIENDSISIDQVDFLGIINEKTLDAKKINIDGIDLEIYRDKRIAFPEWQRRPLPQVELHNLDFTIQIDTINLNDGYIGYQEHAEKSNTPGEIFFSDLNAKIINVSNDSAHLLKYPKTNISATTNVFGKGKITAQFQFDMIDPENIHTYGIEVDPFDLTEFNRILIPNASAQVKSGINERIIMTARANENYSYGEMTFYYNDLKVQLLNRETETPKGLGNILGSFFANTFIIRTNNPKNLVLRKGDIFFERDEKRAIFNYWTKTFLSGVVSSIGAVNNKKKIRKMQEEKLKELEEKQNENLTLHK